MAVTWAAALAALAVGLLVPSLHPAFAASPSRRLLDLLLVSIGLMLVHKLESYLTGEFEQCPVYLGLPAARWARGVSRAVFVVFCSLFLAFMLLIALVMRGAPWVMLLVGVWCAQGLHEIHHLAKSLVRRRYYPGTASGLLFSGFMALAFVPEYAKLVAPEPRHATLGYGAALLLLLLGFLLEDRSWWRARLRAGL